MVTRVFLVESDELVSGSLFRMLEQEQIEVAHYQDPVRFCSECNADMVGCLIVDMHFRDANGLEVQHTARRSGCELPFIVTSERGSVKEATAAMRQGAIDYVERPVNREMLLHRITQAFEMDQERRLKRIIHEEIDAKLDELTPREREVLDLVVAGKLTKQISGLLGISTKTVEVHRYNLTKKMKVESVAQLFQMIMEHKLTNPVSTLGKYRRLDWQNQHN